MNKRLLLSLYDRSGLGAYMPVDLKGHELEVEEHMEKFAELIVQECCDVLTENVEVALNASGSPVYPEGLVYEHFGVE